MCQPLAADVMLRDILFHSCQRQRTRRFSHGADIFEQVFHRRANRIAVDGDDIVKILLAEAEGLVTDTFHRHAFGKQPDARQIDRMPGVQRGFQTGGVLCFHRDHFDLRHQLLDQHRYACGKPTAANRDKHAVQVCILL